MDPGEDDWATALREVREESGIDADKQLNVHRDFKHEMFYTTKANPKYPEQRKMVKIQKKTMEILKILSF